MYIPLAHGYKYGVKNNGNKVHTEEEMLRSYELTIIEEKVLEDGNILLLL